MSKWKIDRVAATEVTVNEHGEVVISQDANNGANPSVVVLPRAQVARLVRYLKSAASNAETRDSVPQEVQVPGPRTESAPDESSCAKCGAKPFGAVTLVWSMGQSGQDITTASAIMMCEACSVGVVDAWNEVAEEAVES
jgi:hypothetical protein